MWNGFKFYYFSGQDPQDLQEYTIIVNSITESKISLLKSLMPWDRKILKILLILPAQPALLNLFNCLTGVKCVAYLTGVYFFL